VIRLLSPPGIITGGIVVLSVAGGMVVGAGIASVLLAAHAIKRARA
jgi:hypothetical protein